MEKLIHRLKLYIKYNILKLPFTTCHIFVCSKFLFKFQTNKTNLDRIIREILLKKWPKNLLLTLKKGYIIGLFNLYKCEIYPADNQLFDYTTFVVKS